jgi:hypothetical protein
VTFPASLTLHTASALDATRKSWSLILSIIESRFVNFKFCAIVVFNIQCLLDKSEKNIIVSVQFCEFRLVLSNVGGKTEKLLQEIRLDLILFESVFLELCMHWWFIIFILKFQKRERDGERHRDEHK